VEQARRAINLYCYFLDRAGKSVVSPSAPANREWQQAIDQMVKAMRLKHLSYRTEQTYLTWMRSFYSFLNGTSPWQLESRDVLSFLTHLAVERKVAKSTQNLAFNAILFFFRRVLDKDIGELWQAVRAKRKQRLPVVLTPEEVQLVFDHMKDVHLLMIRLIYAGGLRLNEAVRLRVKDLDFQRGCLIIRAAKGDKDRETLFPEALQMDFKEQLEAIRPLYGEDRETDDSIAKYDFRTEGLYAIVDATILSKAPGDIINPAINNHSDRHPGAGRARSEALALSRPFLDPGSSPG